MFRQIMELLKTQSWEFESENIEIAKGRNELPTTYKKAYKQFKRNLKWRLRK